MKIAEKRQAVIDKVSKINSVQLYWLSKAIDIILGIKKKAVSDADISRWCAFTAICDADDDRIGTICDFVKYAEATAKKTAS